MFPPVPVDLELVGSVRVSLAVIVVSVYPVSISGGSLVWLKSCLVLQYNCPCDLTDKGSWFTGLANHDCRFP